MTVGRFAPSPSGPLHLGNLRTALVAWCAARHQGGTFLVRMEDLTTGAAPVAEQQQLGDLAALGIDHDGPVLRQSERAEIYDAAIRQLSEAGRTYPCFCTRSEVRREVEAAAGAPHATDRVPGGYPGTCRNLSSTQVAEHVASGRQPSLRLRADDVEVTVSDVRRGELSAVVDDFVLCRADGLAAYNLAVVIDDAAQGVDQVVRGDDLWPTTPRQVALQNLLGLPTPEYLHVPLVLGPDGERLAKRHGAVTLADQVADGASNEEILALLAASLGLAAPGESVAGRDLIERFDPSSLPSEPWMWSDSPAP